MHELAPPEWLYKAILMRISFAQRRSARFKTACLGTLSLVFGLMLLPALQYAGQELYTSGFYTYVSLIFTDGHSVLSAWQEFAFLIVESLPSIALLFLFGIVVALTWSLRRTFIHARTAFSF